MSQSNIRNFVIIAHIDVGKSTLADRMLEMTGTVQKEKMRPQILDTMELERERGITIKMQPVTMIYRSPSTVRSKTVNGERSTVNDSEFILNLIDTPGHIDFSYEVSRSLKAVEGAILLLDATKGIQAQTLANLEQAQKQGLKIIPVINKIDLENAEVEEVAGEIAKLLKIDQNEILKISAKTGQGIRELLETIVQKIPSPKEEGGGIFKALIFDSVFSDFRGAISFVRVFSGQIKKGERVKFFSSGKIETLSEVGEFKLKLNPKDSLGAGEIGYLVTGLKDIRKMRVGDTISADSPAEVSPIGGFEIPKPMVFANFYLLGGESHLLRKSLEKLQLNDSSLTWTPENSYAFGQGFRCGFLGLLHLDITRTRLEREYQLDLIVSHPTVLYKIHRLGTRQEYEEPWVKLEIMTPPAFLGKVIELAQNRRAIYKGTRYLEQKVILEYEAPLSELIIDFYDKLKSVSAGYASQNYKLIGWRPGDLVKVDILVAGEKVEEFSRLVPRFRVQAEARHLIGRLKELIPRQMFEVSLQAAIGAKILARENIPAQRKDVVARLYGGDRTRKDKLLEKQAAGKKKMKMLGRVQIPSDVFIEILKS